MACGLSLVLAAPLSAAQKVAGKVCFDTALEEAKLIAITRDNRFIGIGAGLGMGDSQVIGRKPPIQTVR